MQMRMLTFRLRKNFTVNIKQAGFRATLESPILLAQCIFKYDNHSGKLLYSAFLELQQRTNHGRH